MRVCVCVCVCVWASVCDSVCVRLRVRVCVTPCVCLRVVRVHPCAWLPIFQDGSCEGQLPQLVPRACVVCTCVRVRASRFWRPSSLSCSKGFRLQKGLVLNTKSTHCLFASLTVDERSIAF